MGEGGGIINLSAIVLSLAFLQLYIYSLGKDLCALVVERDEGRAGVREGRV